MDYSRGNRREGGFGGRSFGQRRDSFGSREMHKATCANCGNECTVPFKPDGKRPVYCRDCYRNMKESGQTYSKKEPAKEEASGSESQETETEESSDESDEEDE